MKEIWKDIPGFENLYQVSNLGRVKSLPRKTNERIINGKILTPINNGYGYMKITINGKKKYVHQLVAQAFILNPNNYKCVNHKDENKLNNNVDNLEWCSVKYNCNYGIRNEKIGKKVIQYDKQMNEIRKYKTITEASKICNILISSISSSCRKKRKCAGGYIWRFTNE